MLLIKTKLWEQASCPPQHSEVKHKAFWMGHNLLRRYGFNQRTMTLVEQENSQPQYSTHHLLCKEKKKIANGNTSEKVLSLLCLSLVEPVGGGRSKLCSHPRWLFWFLEALGTTALTSSSEGINLALCSGSNFPTERHLTFNDQGIWEPGKFTLCCFRLHKICFIACLHKILL